MGIYFGTETTDKLDSYEEGVSSSYMRGAEGGSTLFSNCLYWKKIGKQVQITCTLNNVTNSGIGGTWYMTLPFTPANQVNNQEWQGSDVYWYPQSVWDDYTDFNGFTPSVTANTAELYLRVNRTEQDKQTVLSGGSGARNGNISTASGMYLRWTITYWTA